ncbi:unnamed protein product [Dicrocoelium dendriticum]|nr:unnamed protein product [Dicrocoelium dendriticum]
MFVRPANIVLVLIVATAVGQLSNPDRVKKCSGKRNNPSTEKVEEFTIDWEMPKKQYNSRKFRGPDCFVANLLIDTPLQSSLVSRQCSLNASAGKIEAGQVILQLSQKKLRLAGQEDFGAQGADRLWDLLENKLWSLRRNQRLRFRITNVTVVSV